jgi:hypothetical protein
MSYLKSIRGWFNMVNNSTPAESKTRTYVPPPSQEESIVEEPTVNEEIIEAEEITRKRSKNKSENNEE